MRIVITGGAGFIGGNFVNYMVDKYPEDYFICIDFLTYAGNLETLESIINNENFKFIKIMKILNFIKIMTILKFSKIMKIINLLK